MGSEAVNVDGFRFWKFSIDVELLMGLEVVNVNIVELLMGSDVVNVDGLGSQNGLENCVFRSCECRVGAIFNEMKGITDQRFKTIENYFRQRF